VKRFVRFLTERWTAREAAATLLVTILTAYSLTNLREWPFGGVVVFLLLVVQGVMWYSTGRNHQSQEDSEQQQAALRIAQETRQMVLEAYLFEMWWVDMRRDPEHDQILIHTRVSVN